MIQNEQHAMPSSTQIKLIDGDGKRGLYKMWQFRFTAVCENRTENNRKYKKVIY